MELALPIIALGSLYVATNQNNRRPAAAAEGFRTEIPNTDIPDRNYYNDGEDTTETPYSRTSALSVTQSYDGGAAYTDKYFRDPNARPPAVGEETFMSLTGEKVTTDYFQHGNMKPFFGAKIRGQSGDSNRAESVLDNYIGAGSQTITKKEQSPLFEAMDNMQYAFGAPNQSDFIQSRQVGSMRMANVQPFQSIRVGPGLGLGTDPNGAGGFNSGMMSRELWQDKTVDELRVACNPKATEYTLLGYETAPKHYVQATPTADMLGEFQKNRPDRAFDMDADRYFTQVGAGGEAAPVNGRIIRRDTARQDTSREYAGGAAPTNEATYVTGEYCESHNQNLPALPLTVASATGRYHATEADYGMKGVFAYPNNRTTPATDDNYFGMVSTGGVIGAVIAPLLDVLRGTRKEETAANMRIYGSAGTTVKESYIFDPEQATPLPTNRDMFKVGAFDHAQVNRFQDNTGYQTTNVVAPATARQETLRDYTGVAGSYLQAQTSYAADLNYKPNDLKASTVAGYTPGANMSIFNNYVHLSHAPDDSKQAVKRVTFSDRNAYIPPAADSMGAASCGRAEIGGSQIQMERNTADILDAFKNNPFTHPLSSAR